MDIEVKDWPLAELDRFKAKRPNLYAQMTTRLMTIPDKSGEPGAQECVRLKQLQAEGKVQQLPATCLKPAATAAKKGGAVAKSGGSL